MLPDPSTSTGTKPPHQRRSSLILPKDEHFNTLIVVYDLADPEAWERAGRERAAWGRVRTKTHTLDNDHIAIEFRAGGALEKSA